MTSRGPKAVAVKLQAWKTNELRTCIMLNFVSLSGDFLPLQIIHAGKTGACHPCGVAFPKGFCVTQNPTHWSNKELNLLTPSSSNMLLQKEKNLNCLMYCRQISLCVCLIHVYTRLVHPEVDSWTLHVCFHQWCTVLLVISHWQVRTYNTTNAALRGSAHIPLGQSSPPNSNSPTILSITSLQRKCKIIVLEVHTYMCMYPMRQKNRFEQ
jgi:hypothetical protein